MSSTSSTQSVPMLIYTATRGGATPALNAMATIMAVTTIVIAAVGFALYRLVARREQIPGTDVEEIPVMPAPEGAL
jgi:ABC-type spermidine/putrescine transport system permease subunit II